MSPHPSLPEPEPEASHGSDAVEELLAACLQLPGAERNKMVEALCQEHPELAGELRSRLQALRAMGVESVEKLSGDGEFPEHLGDFRLIERIGSGGMGVVYLAEQTSLGREVVVKLIRPEHLYFPASRARFRREVEAVARLRHPGIVPVYTVGEEQGLPYFAMEHVPGRTLGDILDGLHARAPESLSGADLSPAFGGSWIEACLSVVEQVARALEHAHGEGIVHRDIKPSNIMLTDEGRAMLLDFGLTSSDQPGELTQSGSQIGTLYYMSPEQVRASRYVDARTDVYSLGATLYELLTLLVPYAGDDRQETERRILEGRPPPLRPRNRKVPTDVETVCLKALSVEPGRRYSSATAFGRDLGNLLARRPVEARPPGATYRLRRWVQRNPAWSTALALGAVALVGTPTAILVQQKRHTSELEQRLTSEEAAHGDAREVTNYLVDLFDLATPDRARGEDVTVVEILDRGRERVAEELAGQPLLQAGLLRTIGRVYRKVGRFEESRTTLEEALALHQEHDAAEPILAEAHAQLAETFYKLARLDEAEKHLRSALALRVAHFGEDHWSAATTGSFLGAALVQSLRFDEAEPLLRDNLARMESDPRTPVGSIARAHDGLGQLLYRRGFLAGGEEGVAMVEEAAYHFGEMIRLLKEDGETDTVDWATACSSYGLVLKALGRLDESDSYYGKALALYRRLLPPEAVEIGNLLINYAGLHEARQELDEAVPLLEEAVRIFEAAFPDGHSNTAQARGNLAGDLFRAERYEEAARLYPTVIDEQQQFEATRVYVPYSHYRYGRCLAALGDLEGGERELVKSVKQLLELRGADHPHTQMAQRHLDEVRAARAAPGGEDD